MSLIIPGVGLSNVDSKDIGILGYAQTGLAAQTLTWEFDGRTFRRWALDTRYTAGGTLVLKIKVSNEDVASGSVSVWHDVTNDLIGAVSITASGFVQFRVAARWVQIEVVLTSTGNSLALDLSKGWD